MTKDMDSFSISMQEWQSWLESAGEQPNVKYVLDGNPQDAVENANKWARAIVDLMKDAPVIIVTGDNQQQAKFDRGVLDMEY